MKTKTSELTGAALDWAVLVALGVKTLGESSGTPMWKEFLMMHGSGDTFVEISEHWEEAGPIIERENVRLTPYGDGTWIAEHPGDFSGDWGTAEIPGPTPLIAAMRCFVASKFGEEVDVPEELCK